MSTFKDLIGKTILTWELEPGGEILNFIVNPGGGMLKTEKLVYRAEGDCCAHCWVESVNGVPGGIVLETEDKGWTQDADSDPERDSVNETGFWTLKTTSGYIDIETRLSHNGYYGGWIEYVKTIEL